MDQALGHLVEQEFGSCTARSFCTECRATVCVDCCVEHRIQHPHDGALNGRQVIEILDVEGFSAITAKDVMRYSRPLGSFNWNKIQRLGGTWNKYIYLSSCPPKSKGPKHCRCGKSIQYEMAHCSPRCKLDDNAGGNGNMAIVQALVDANFTEPRDKDRFCTVCMLAFSSEHCQDHEAHHGDEAAAAAGGYVLEIIRQEGRLYVPAEQVPDELRGHLNRVQHLLHGQDLIAIRPRAPVPLPHHVGPLCRRQLCLDQVTEEGQACSLSCYYY